MQFLWVTSSLFHHTNSSLKRKVINIIGHLGTVLLYKIFPSWTFPWLKGQVVHSVSIWTFQITKNQTVFWKCIDTVSFLHQIELMIHELIKRNKDPWFNHAVCEMPLDMYVILDALRQNIIFWHLSWLDSVTRLKTRPLIKP